MIDIIQEKIMTCGWGTTHFFFFSDNVFNNLIYYSHLFPFIVSAILGIFVLIKGKNQLVSRSLATITGLISLWLIGDLILWATESPRAVLFFWALINMVEPIIYTAVLYFTFVFIDQKDVSFAKKILLALPLLPTLFLTHTDFAIQGFDLSNCDRDAVEGWLVYYGYLIELVYIVWLLIFSIYRFIKERNHIARNKIVLVTLGSLGFLITFSFGNIIGSLFADSSILGEYSWTIGQYGIFGVPIFAIFLAYLIVTYNSLNIKVLGSQMLIFGLCLLIGAQLFYATSFTNTVLIVVTLISSILLGYFLVQSVKREVRQKEALEIANDGQSNLIHIINHQIKGYLAKGRNIFSELNSGDYGTVTPMTKTMLDQGFASLTEAVDFVQGVLNSSSVESGTMKYNMAPLNLSLIAEEAVKNQQEPAAAKQLTLINDIEPGIELTGDKVELKEALRNLINNSIIYTQSGSIHVSLKKINNKAVFTVQDTGIGLSPEDKAKLFTKGGRGADSIKINVNSTGYGLSFVKGVTEAHEGKVWAASEGKGKGSTFTMELPLTLSKVALAKSTPTAQKTPRIGA